MLEHIGHMNEHVIESQSIRGRSTSSFTKDYVFNILREKLKECMKPTN